MATIPSAAGIRQGRFEVDANGQATYVLPIEVPPGIAGAHPRLGLAYGHHQGNGVVGVGWSLAGLSAITRSKATWDVDGFNGCIDYGPDDRYVLDGQRLIAVDGQYGQPGTVYYAEVHDWSKAVAGQTPLDGFIVYLKNGAKREYGTTPDSLILAGNSQHVRVWALAATEDLHGNRVEYHYTKTPVAASQDTGAFYLSRIVYTVRADLTANRYVDFTYGPEVRPDVLRTYLGGHAVTTSYRLASIKVSLAGNMPVRTYALAYRLGAVTGLSCLESVTAIGADGKALELVRAAWQDVDKPGFNIKQPASTLLNGTSVLQTIPMDVDGDGITDIVQISTDRNGVLQATPFLASVKDEQTKYAAGTACLLGGYRKDQYQIFPGDFNGNGMTDLVVVYPQQGKLAFDLFLSTGTGFSKSQTTVTSDPWQQGWINVYAIDANADGRTDMVVAYRNRSGLLAFDTYLSTPLGGGVALSATALTTVTQSQAPANRDALLAFDVNGDGMVDMVLLWNDRNQVLNATSFVSQGDQSASNGIKLFSKAVSSNLNVSTLHQVAILPADANGDGVVDLVQVSQSSAVLSIQSFLSDANGGFVARPASTFPGQSVSASSLLPMGVNGGAQTCLVNCWRDVGGVLHATEYGSMPDGQFRLVAEINTGGAFAALANLVGDANGDGKADLLYTYLDRQNSVQVQPLTSDGKIPDLVRQITNALGGVISITYSTLSNPAVYRPGAPAAYPNASARRYVAHLSPAQFPTQEVIGRAICVVSGYTLSSDARMNRYAYERRFAMQYEDARIGLTGRGWQGFAKVTTTDLDTGLLRVQRYLQDFPYQGRLAGESAEVDTTGSDGKVTVRRLGRTVHVYQAVQPTATAKVQEVRKMGALAWHYEGGAQDYAVATSHRYDAYGNPTGSVWHGYVSGIDPDAVNPVGAFPAVAPLATDEVVHTHRQFQNDIAGPRGRWALGYPLFEKLSANAGDGDPAVFRPGDYRLTACTYAPGTCSVRSISRWDNINDVFLKTQLEHDARGNLTAQTRPGGATTRFEYETVYHTYPAKIIAPANDQGVSLTLECGYDPRFGSRVAERDANGFTHIVALDGFGRAACRQGPVPAGCKQRDENRVTAHVTGTQAFGQAAVLTLESLDYLNDGEGGLYAQRDVLQSFPDGGRLDTVWQRHYVDGLGRVALAATQSGRAQGDIAVLTTYAPCGKPASRSLPFFEANLTKAVAPWKVTWSYDAQGRPLRQDTPVGRNGGESSVTTWEYRAGQREIVTEAAGTPQAYVRETAAHFFHGELRQVRADGGAGGREQTRFVYDALGRMLRATDPAGVVNTIGYDSLSRKTRYDNPDQNTTGHGYALSYLHDAGTGMLASITDAAGGVERYAYDALGRVTRRGLSDGREIRQTYDDASVNGNGKLATMTILAADASTELSRRHAYDCYGNTCGETTEIAGAPAPFVMAATFDPLKRRVWQRYPDGSALQRYYTYGVMEWQKLDGALLFYPLERASATGNPGKVDLSERLSAEYKYSPLGLRYSERIVVDDDAPRLSFSMEYDPLGQLLRETESVMQRSESFAYADRRLVAAEVPGFPGGNGRYAYGPGGDLLSKDGRQYSDYNGHFARLIRVGDAVVCRAAQDACGRTASLETEGGTLAFGYDGLGRLARVTRNKELLRRIWSDERGRRVKETRADGSTVYYVGQAYQEQVGRDGEVRVVKTMVDRLGQAACLLTRGGVVQRYYLRRDRKGNITHRFDQNGVLLSSTAYDGFGLPLPASGELLRYEGRIWDAETGQYDFGARGYDPAAGRFLTPDTRLGSSRPERADVWNRYAFELNCPLNHIDPTGHFSWSLFGMYLGMAALTVLGVAASAVTAGASDAAVASLDTAVEGDADIAGGQLASAAERQSGASLAKTVATKMMVGATGGAISGAATGAGTSGLDYLAKAGGAWNWSDLSRAMQTGATSGAVSGWLDGFVSPIIPAATENGILKVLAGAVVSAGADAAGLEAASYAMDHQGASGAELGREIWSGAVKGVVHENVDMLMEDDEAEAPLGGAPRHPAAHPGAGRGEGSGSALRAARIGAVAGMGGVGVDVLMMATQGGGDSSG